METPPEQLQPCVGEGEPVAKMIKGLEAGGVSCQQCLWRLS